ncbi:MAG: tetratricopeptide repeat protein, partial [Candidatus Binatia bacterium]
MTSRVLRCLILAAAIVGGANAAPEPTRTPERLLEMEELPPGFFHLDEWIPPALRGGLAAYEEGRYFTTLGEVQPLLASREPEYAVDDAQFLRALALVAVGWDDLAVPAFKAVLESKEVGPYYVPSLLALVEIHDRAGRWSAIVEAWQRWIVKPLRSGGSRGDRVNELLWEYGELRPAQMDSTRRENKLLSAPEELAVILEKRRERASDRLMYRIGQALLRLGRHEDSLNVLLGIGIESPYYPYARYSMAQNQFALGRADEAWRTLVRLGRYPKLTQEEKLLGSRAKVMQAAIRFE